jgi:hypothetical protein
MRNFLILLSFSLLFSCSPSGENRDQLPFIKGVYGNPGALLEAGYSFDSLGMNAVFVRSISLNREFFDAARQQGCRVYVEFPTLLGRNYLRDNPDAWPALAGLTDVLAPMLFHKMKERPPSWVGEYIAWLDALTGAGETGQPLVWPIVQAHNNPGVVTPEEFRAVMTEGSRPPSTGIMMFSDQALLQDRQKIEVMKQFYFNLPD